MNSYSNDFKKEAIRLSDEIGVKKAAAQLGLPYYTLADWRNRNRDKITGEATAPAKPLDSAAKEARIRQLERENAELRNAHEILKAALGFFVKDRKK